MAAAAQALPTDPGRAPVLMLGTLWPEYDAAYTTQSAPDSPGLYARVRELVAGQRVPVLDVFDAATLTRA